MIDSLHIMVEIFNFLEKEKRRRRKLVIEVSKIFNFGNLKRRRRRKRVIEVSKIEKNRKFFF